MLHFDSVLCLCHVKKALLGSSKMSRGHDDWVIVLQYSTKPLCVFQTCFFLFVCFFCFRDKQWHHQRQESREAGNRSRKSHETVWWKLKTLPLAHRHHLSYPFSLQLMWSDNVMISECSHSSGVSYEFARRLTVCGSFQSDRTQTHRGCWFSCPSRLTLVMLHIHCLCLSS